MTVYEMLINIGITCLMILGWWGANPPWVLGTSVYEVVKLVRGRRLV
jgi:hypothetical protein